MGFQMEIQMDIRIKKCGISNRLNVCIFDDPCLSKFGTLRECPNVAKTRNLMQTFSWKKCSHFSPTNFHLHFHLKSHEVIF